MINWIIGVMVVVTSAGGVYDPIWKQPPWNVFVEGGHFHHSVELKIEDDAIKFRSDAFLMIENLAPCISPENIRAENDDGRATPYQIVDEIGEDGVRRWSIQPIGKFKRAVAILDIDFINKCPV